MFWGATLTSLEPESNSMLNKRLRYLQAIEAKSLFNTVEQELSYKNFERLPALFLTK